MAELVTTTVPLDISIYDQMSPAIAAQLRAARGFRSHALHASASRFTVTEIWDSASDHSAFFDANVKPHLPAEGVTVEINELRNLLTVWAG